jgi:hypothetical protein
LNLHTCCVCTRTTILVHDGLTLSHLYLALVGNGLVLGFASRVVGGVVDGVIDAAADGFADAVDAVDALRPDLMS